MSQFAFLNPEWPAIFEAAENAESLVRGDSRAACFYARRSLELMVHWLYKHDGVLRFPYRDNLSALVHEPTFRQVCGEPVFQKARVIIQLGNTAVHSHGRVAEADALQAARELYHVAYWLARTYARGAKPAPGLAFDPSLVPSRVLTTPQTLEQLQRFEEDLRGRDEKLLKALADKSALDEELRRLRAEIAEVKRGNSDRPDTHDYSEEETRDYFIDGLLREAGWILDQERDREYQVTGMPRGNGIGYVDYVLWGDDGKPLAVVEAKRTKRDPRAGQQQAMAYADCLEREFGRRPVIFYSNGYEHWMWDDLRYPPRSVQGFYTKDELQLLVQRRATRKSLADAIVNESIAGRHYQIRAIRRIAEAFERECDRKALLVMATGAGKTRTVVGLADLLMRCNWAKRILFLADRKLLVNQAVNQFKRHLCDCPIVNLLEEKDSEGRVFVSTYATIMNMIDDLREGQRRFGVGHFDLVVIDEAHRSVFQKYGAILDYFDALLVGLTATPKDEVDRNTYGLFDLEPGVPTDAYSLEEAVRDHFLVPWEAVAVPLKFQREGINYNELSEEDKETWESIDWDEDGNIPDHVEAAAVNAWLFNKDTVDKVLEHLMTRGLKVSGGDRLGKTIIFAKNHDHAQFIADRFNANYPHHAGHFARVIDFQTEYVEQLKGTFEQPDKMPHIAISVDMLDTGVDVPPVVNLVFFKPIRSKIKFWQMCGRGTRLCPDLFGPGEDKTFFYIFDYCQNLEFFSQDPVTVEGSVAEPLGQRVFRTRLKLLQVLDGRLEGGVDAAEGAVRKSTAELLQAEVAAMNVDNFIVRPKRLFVEKFREPSAWIKLDEDAISQIAGEVAGLPSEQGPESEETKRFDLLVLNLQLAMLRADAGFQRLREQVVAIAGLLEELSSIPMVREQLPLIQDLQSAGWWQDVTVPMLESVRRRVRNLVRLIEKRKRRPIYTDFEDLIGSEAVIAFSDFGGGANYHAFRTKSRQFLRTNENNIVLFKVRRNEPLTSVDLAELEQMLVEAGVGSQADVERAKQDSQGLGLFIRSLIGLDREAAKGAFAEFLADKTLTANQVEFINLIVDHLTAMGAMDAALLYASPFTDISPKGPDALFASVQVDRIIAILEDIRRRAAS